MRIRGRSWMTASWVPLRVGIFGVIALIIVAVFLIHPHGRTGQFSGHAFAGFGAVLGRAVGASAPSSAGGAGGGFSGGGCGSGGGGAL